MRSESRTLVWLVTVAMTAGLLAVPGSAPAQTRIHVNGRPLATSASPIMLRGRTLVPMRDIFESLGATVSWYPTTRTAIAQRGGTAVQLPVGRHIAYINGRAYILDAPARIIAGNTMVPLRFVSESLGANVVYHPSTRTVSISLPTALAARPPFAGQPGAGRSTVQVVIPRDTVLPVTMNDRIGSTISRVGDRFTATLNSRTNGDQPFPRGTRIVGVVRDVMPRRGNTPGQIDVDFVSAQLPDGRMVPIRGTLTSLDRRDVQERDGLLVARSGSPSRSRFIGYGAGAGLVIGMLTGSNALRGVLYGAAAGFLSSLLVRDRARNVVVEPGTQFGVRLTGNVSYQASRSFYGTRMAYLGRAPSRYGAGRATGPVAVVVNGYRVSFGSTLPEAQSGGVLVPMEPVLNAAGVRYNYDPYRRMVQVVRPDSSVIQMLVGQSFATRNGVRVNLDSAAVLRGNVVLVPPSFLSLATGMNATWNSGTNTVTLSRPR